MNKILIIKHQEGFGHTTADQRMKVAKSIADTWNETGIIAVPAFWNYELVDCDKFMGVEIDKEIVNEKFENGCFEEPRHNPWNVQTALLNGDTCIISTTKKE